MMINTFVGSDIRITSAIRKAEAEANAWLEKQRERKIISVSAQTIYRPEMPNIQATDSHWTYHIITIASDLEETVVGRSIREQLAANDHVS